ncbi:MAG TPA: acyl-CoA dehydrogenase family protein [Polyangiaceae bacterium]|nr:acyl-CoA dehydrogenase family protein [Polyangiaceae bacterium]
MIEPYYRALLDESHVLFHESCRRFADQEIAPEAAAWDETGSFPRELYAKAGEAGILGAVFPEPYGGGGGDPFHLILGVEALMSAGVAGVVAGLGSAGIALPPIVSLGTEEQKCRFLPPVLRGERIAALAITEPGTGSDVAGIKTRARRDGDAYLLDGEKTFITSGVRADLVTVLARTGESPHGGLTFFVVERGTPGFSVSGSLKKMGWRASDTASLSFDGCRVPAENRLGDEGAGFRACMQNFQMERLTLAAYGYASAEVALAEAECHARARSAFGRPLSGFQVTRHKLARMATQTRAAKSFVYLVADAMRRGLGALEEVSEAKNFASLVALDVCNEAVQILGGMGYMQGTIVERLYRDVRVLPIGGGTVEVMNEVIAKVRGYGS